MRRLSDLAPSDDLQYAFTHNAAERYVAAQGFLKRLKALRRRLTTHQLSTLRGLALSGDLEGAEKGLWKIVMREGNDEMRTV